MNSIKQALEEALCRGGAILKNGFEQPKSIRYKSSANLVTKTDRALELAIAKIIRKKFPHHMILGEEMGLRQAGKSPVGAQGAAQPKWIIDPIDGTTNFAHGLPLACVSIAFESEGEIKLGGVFNPLMNELFLAEKGRGATLNGKSICVSSVKTLKESLLVTGFPYGGKTKMPYYLRFFESFTFKTHGVRRLGSAAIDLCYVACGRLDGFWEFNLNVWDIAAGYLILKEAGGRLTDFHGNPINIYGKELLASNNRIHGSMLNVIRKHL